MSFFYVQELDAGMLKQASTRSECESIMREVYEENPSHWPYGLNVDGHDSVYMIREASTHKAVGFTGWQEFAEGHRKIGYYSIGLRKAFRGKSYARAAVAQLIAKKAATVDEVRAFIVPGNNPSVQLANRLGVKVVHNV